MPELISENSYVPVGLVILTAAGVFGWVRYEMGRVQKQIDEINGRYERCARLQGERFEELRDAIEEQSAAMAEIKETGSVLRQKLEDFIHYCRENGGPHGRR